MPALTSRKGSGRPCRTRRTRLSGPLPTRLLTAAVLLGSCGAGFAYTDDATHALDAVGRVGGFEVRYVKLTGQKETSDSAIVASVGLDPKATILSVDVDAARERLETLPWVTSATVRKVLPGTLDVAIVEAAPYARWRNDGAEVLIAEDGTVLADEVPSRFVELPLVGGPDANTSVREAREILETSPQYDIRTRAAILVSKRRWDLVFDTGATVMLPENGAPEALVRLAELEREGAITLAPVIVDMRLPDRTAVELAPKGSRQMYIAPEDEGQDAAEPADLLAAAIAEATSSAGIDPLAAAIAEAQR